MLLVKDLVKHYGEQEAVRGISFHVEQGQIVGLLGENGAGKSTTMNMITGYISATAGDVWIQGIDILEHPKEAKKLIGYLPEQPPLYDKMTVKEYLRFVAELKGLKKEAEQEALSVMEKTGLAERESMLIQHLSKGYRQRVGLAQALIGNPPLLILDEPMVGLDPNQMIEIRQLIRSLAGDHAVILSSHILSEIESICDHIIIMSHGEIIAENETDKLESEQAGQNKLKIVIKGDKQEIFKVVRESGLLKSFEYVRDIEPEVYEFSAIAAEDKDVRDELFVLFAEHKMVVYSLNIKQLSLEDVFIKLTGKEINDESSI
jgi:ABC-2 type transport system ATP-binding protein